MTILPVVPVLWWLTSGERYREAWAEDVLAITKLTVVHGASGKSALQGEAAVSALLNRSVPDPPRDIAVAPGSTAIAEREDCRSTRCAPICTCIKQGLEMMGVFAEFERAMIQERVRAGLARARAEGKRLGRPKIAERTERSIQAALSKKGRPGLRKIAATLGVGVGTVHRVSRELG